MMDTQGTPSHNEDRLFSTTNSENVFLLIPNLVGYARVVLAVFSLYLMPMHPRLCSFLYSVSCLLDAIDGMLARKFNQATQFGAILDMTIDRCTTSCLLVFLAVAYPKWSILFQCLLSLDLASHYMHIYATLVMGTTNQSHKKIDENRPWVMRIYYSNRNVLFTVCALNELFFITLYLVSFSTNMPSLTDANAYIWTQPVKFLISKLTLAVSGVFMLFKQYVNIIQMVEACKWIAQGDAERREHMRVSNRLQKMQ